jgi:acetyl esterase/lipase
MRAVDYLVTDPKIDPARIAVVGHSRSGKAALWAGAQDERIALTVSNDSGCAGAAISRRPVGENVALVTDLYPYWFADNFASFAGRESELPIDQHQLVALLAPRAVAVGSASEDNWADPEGEFQGLAFASPVYALFGFAAIEASTWPKPDAFVFVAPRNYHLRVGVHDLVEYDWGRYVDAAERIWPR